MQDLFCFRKLYVTIYLVYVRKYKANTYFKHKIKENLAYPGISSSYHYCSFSNKRYHFPCPCFPLPDNMKTLKNLSKTLNNYFILIVLLVFYFPVIGIAFVFFKLFSQDKKSADSFWNIPKTESLDKRYFESPY